MHHFTFTNKQFFTHNPQDVIDKMPEFLKELEKRLNADSRGGKIVYAGPARADNINGFDVDIEDKNGVVSTFYIDPFTCSFYTVL